MMTSFIMTTKPQLAAEFTEYGVDLPNACFISKLGIPTRPEQKSDKPVIKWPDGISPAAVLGGLTASPMAHIAALSVDTEETHLIFASGKDGIFTLFSMSGEAVTLVCGLTKADICATFAEILGLAETAPPSAFTVETDFNATVALFAIIDRLKLLLAASLVERSIVPSLDMRLEDLSEQVDDGQNKTDYRWFCAILPIILSKTIPKTKSALKSGCKTLEKQGLLAKISKGKNVLYRPNNRLVSLALELIIPMPNLIFFDDEGTKTQALFAGRSTWSMRYVNDKCCFESVDGLAAFGLISTCLDLNRRTDHAADATSERQPQALNKAVCVQCGTQHNPSQKFCTKCGAEF